MAVLNIFLTVALAVCALYAVQIVVITQRLTRLRWKTVRTRTLTQDEVPSAQRQILDQATALLLPLGFVYRYSGATEKTLVIGTGAEAWTYSDVYQHVDGHTHAVASPSDVPEHRQPYALQFVTCLDGGGSVITLNCYRHYLPFTIPGREIFDDYLPSLAQAWQRHLERVRALATGITTDGIAVCRRLRDMSEQLVPTLHAQGDLLPAGAQGHYRMPWLAALRCALRVVHGQWRAAWVQAAVRKEASPQGQASGAPQASDSGAQAADIHAFHAQLALQRSHQMGARNKVWLFLITAALFLLVGGFWFSWHVVPIVLAVVALHEGGHYLAMRLTGYRNVSVFFLPGLGGLATGDKANATPFEKLFVYLAGPVPGIAIAAVALWAMWSGTWLAPGWLAEFLWVSLVINYLNLLPITPLDGGRVVETFLFARLPFLRFVFAASSCALLFGFCVWMDDTVARVLAVLLALGLPLQWRLMHLARAVRREPQGAWDEAQAVEQIFTSLQQQRFRAWSFAKRASAAMALLPELMGRRPTLAEAVGGLGIYAACLFGPLGIAYMALPQLRSLAVMLYFQTNNLPADDVVDEERAKTYAPAPDWNAQLAQPDKLSRDELLAAHLGAAAQADDFEDANMAHRHFTAAWGLAQGLPQRDLRRIDALLGLARTDPAPGAQAAHLNQVVDELSQPQGPERAKVAQAKEALAYAENVLAQRIALLRDAIALRRDGDASSRHQLATTQLALAQALDVNADSSGAQAVLQERVDGLLLPSPTDRSRTALNQRTARVRAQVQLAWFLIDHDQTTDAHQLAWQALESVPQKPTVSWLTPKQQVLEVLLWAELESRQTANLAARWEALEAVREQTRFGASPKVLVHEIDRVLVGNALGDAGLQRQGRAGIQESLARFKGRPVPLCSSSRSDSSGAQAQASWGDWHRRQRDARTRLLTQLGACKTL